MNCRFRRSDTANRVDKESLIAEPLDSDEEQESKASEDAESHMLSDVNRILTLTPTERLRELANAAHFFSAVRRV